MTHEKTKIWLAVCALLASMPAFVLGIGMISQISAGFAGIFWGAVWCLTICCSRSKRKSHH